ncbi:methyltransferase-like protein 25 [Camponotus floridanus]|uniref:methyltransferase-like protein 25 n=1 Tax=Camponotus floridanus TaxID=104421 RepID=UPI00059B5EBA|nr:methyltransferase-like protein 25 [Camponotus floridanus]
MAEYNNYFEKTLDFINIYQELIDCHLVDFITEKLWDKCLPEKLKSELENININDDIWMESNTSPELSSFIQLTRALSLESCPAVICVDDLLKLLPQVPSKEPLIKNKFIDSKSQFMNTKKSYEIDVLGKIIAEMALSTHSLVIDAGAGKGYLSTYLSEHFDVPVLAIDSSQVCHKGAINRQEKIRKRKQSLTKTRYVVQELDETTDYNKIVNTNYPDWSVNRNLILTGLHTCGMLVHSIMKASLYAKDIRLLFVVPCCYHLADESLSGRWIFSKNAKMLAQQSIERSRHKHLSPSLFYRAVLQIILHSMGYYNTKVGRGGPLDNFADYAKWALSKIGIDNKQIPSTCTLQEIYQSHIHFESKLRLFQILRIYTSSVVEAAIMLDKIIFLQNNAQHSKIAIVRLFDPTVSPRCYAILMIK